MRTKEASIFQATNFEASLPRIAQTCAAHRSRRAMSASSLWGGVEASAPDPVMGLVAAFKRDPAPHKVNLAQGAYRGDDGLPFVLDAVRRAEAAVVEDRGLSKCYSPIDGTARFRGLAAALLFCTSVDDVPALSARGDLDHVATVQSLSGTGALKLGAEFIHRLCGGGAIWVSQPTWANHRKIFEGSGLTMHTYPYLNDSNEFDITAMCAALEELPEHAVVLLHMCAHNPTGVDPSLEEWGQLRDLVRLGVGGD